VATLDLDQRVVVVLVQKKVKVDRPRRGVCDHGVDEVPILASLLLDFLGDIQNVPFKYDPITSPVISL
jgi:hypothetical protein